MKFILSIILFIVLILVLIGATNRLIFHRSLDFYVFNVGLDTLITETQNVICSYWKTLKTNQCFPTQFFIYHSHSKEI